MRIAYKKHQNHAVLLQKTQACQARLQDSIANCAPQCIQAILSATWPGRPHVNRQSCLARGALNASRLAYCMAVAVQPRKTSPPLVLIDGLGPRPDGEDCPKGRRSAPDLDRGLLFEICCARSAFRGQLEPPPLNLARTIKLKPAALNNQLQNRPPLLK